MNKFFAILAILLSPLSSQASIKAIVFDVFGTTVDWRTNIIAEGQALGKSHNIEVDWPEFADAWGQAYGASVDQVRRGVLPWMSLDELHRRSLETLLDEFEVSGLSEAEKNHFSTVWHRLSPWPDSVEGLNRLRLKFKIAPLSNGNVSLLTDLAAFAHLPWDYILSAEEVHRYKPDPKVYLYAVEHFGLQPEEVMMVAAHPGDLTVPRKLGMKTAYIHRPYAGSPAIPPRKGEFDFIVQNFLELADQLYF